MKANFTNQARLLAIMALVALLAVTYGCDGSSTSINPPATFNYEIEGALVSDLNADLGSGDTSQIAVRLRRNDSALITADVVFDDDTLVFNRTTFAFDSVYSFASGFSNMLPTAIYPLSIQDESRFGDTLFTTQPDTFRIDFYTGDSTVPNTNGQEIQISWTASFLVDGYVIVAVHEDYVNTGLGYSEYVTSQATQTTIPPDAFRSPVDTAEVDTGWYYLMVYGYTGAPDSVLASELLPVPLPSQLPDNIDVNNLSGHFGTVGVTRRVPHYVVSQ